MKLWVKALTAPRFEIQVNETEKVSSIKDMIVARLKAQGVQVNGDCRIVHKGKVLRWEKYISDCGVAAEDHLVFLYDLMVKASAVPPPAPVVAAAPPAIAATPQAVPAAGALPADPNQIRGVIGNIMNNLTQRLQQQQGQTAQPAVAPAAPAAAPSPQQQRPPAAAPFAAPAAAATQLPGGFQIPQGPVMVMQVPMPDRTALDELLVMGFPEIRARRALLLNGLAAAIDMEAGLDYLLIHGQSPHVDNPQLSPDEVRSLLQQLEEFQRNQQEEEPVEPQYNQVQGFPAQPIANPGGAVIERMQEAVRNNRCTFTVTGRSYHRQGWYFCYTCGFVDSEGVCESCKNVCHAGHKVSERIRESTFFCDCGASGTCKCCGPPSNQ